MLDRSQRLARLTIASWPSVVEQRLEEGQELYGDSWTQRSSADLLEEVSAEAIDAGAWSALAIQSLSELDSETVATVGEMIARAVGAAAEAHAYVAAAQAALRKAST